MALKTNTKIRVLIVDDSALMRKKIKEILEQDPEIEVVAAARDGEESIQKARDTSPDVITMDVNMPRMDGITALQHILYENICPVVMLSSLTQDGATTTFEALELGAFDFVAKPGGTISLTLESVTRELIAKVKLAAKNGTMRKIRAHNNIIKQKQQLLSNPVKGKGYFAEATKAVAIGVSTGGPQTLSEIIPLLPPDLDAAVFLVQHLPANFTSSFANRLNQTAQMVFKEADAGDLVETGHGYVGKGGYHLLLRQVLGAPLRLRLATKPEHLFMPSVDVMMEAVLEVFGKKTVGVLLTGMGDDGAESMVKIKKAGGITIAESEESAIIYGMCGEAIARGGASIVAPAHRIAEEIVRAVKLL